MSDSLLRDALAELIGTFVLVFVGAFAVAATVQNGFDVTVPALAHGLILVGIIYMYGHISGAHVNPAVTLGLLVGAKITPVKAAAYMLAQFIGGILAAALLAVILGGTGNMGETTGALTANEVWRAALFEAVMAFFLVSAVFQAAVYGKAGPVAGVAIGFTLAGCILAGGAYTGASVNPARTLGPALLAGNLDYVLPYFVGLFAGGAVAGLLHSRIFPDRAA